jgi:AcrR family transcriptional regulator
VSTRRDRKAGRHDLADQIVDTAIALAEEHGWENLRLYQVAQRLDIGLDAIGDRFRDLDAVGNAWFARARRALLQVPHDAVAGRPAPERIHAAMMAWFDALADHREVTVQILSAKLYPSHPHHWGPMIFDLSRLIHDVLDVAQIASTGRRRQLAEAGLTLIFLATLRDWRRNPSGARRRLGRRLAMADRVLAGRLAESSRPRKGRVEGT